MKKYIAIIFVILLATTAYAASVGQLSRDIPATKGIVPEHKIINELKEIRIAIEELTLLIALTANDNKLLDERQVQQWDNWRKNNQKSR